MKSNAKKYFIITISIMSVVIVALSVVLGIQLFGGSDQSYYDMKVQSYATQNANLSKGQIVFLGDSITDLYPLDDYFADLDVATYNRGIGGDTVEGVIKRLKVSVFDLEPSKVVLLIGANNVNGGHSNSHIIKEYRKLLNLLKTNLPTTEVIVMSCISQNELLLELLVGKIDLDKNITQIMELNPQIEDLAQEFGYLYLDLFTPTADINNVLIDDYSDDGIHLNANGFEVWTSIVKPYLIEE